MNKKLEKVRGVVSKMMARYSVKQDRDPHVVVDELIQSTTVEFTAIQDKLCYLAQSLVEDCLEENKLKLDPKADTHKEALNGLLFGFIFLQTAQDVFKAEVEKDELEAMYNKFSERLLKGYDSELVRVLGLMAMDRCQALFRSGNFEKICGKYMVERSKGLLYTGKEEHFKFFSRLMKQVHNMS